ITFGARSGVSYALAVDSLSGTFSGALLVIAENDVEISSPSPNAVFKSPASFTIEARRTGIARSLAEIDFYQDGAFVSSLTDLPFELPIQIAASGNHALYLQSRDTQGVVTKSDAVPIVVRPANDDFSDAEEV